MDGCGDSDVGARARGRRQGGKKEKGGNVDSKLDGTGYLVF